ncbi:MAG: inositol 2-dehydrogenase, partial [Gammaproteobacteria bacterium]
MPMVGVAVVGCGRIGRVHARNAAGNSRATLVMVFDVAGTAAQETATELGVKAARSLEEVLSDHSVDAVLLATPTDTHVPLITAAVEAGKAVLCEKPV